MATTKLADIYEPKPFNNAVYEAAIEKNAFIASGVMTNDPRLVNLASTGGQVGEMPHWNPLGTDEPNYSSDDETQNSTPKKVTTDKSLYRRAMMNQSWSVMDFTQELAGNVSDPLGAVTGRVGQYWATQTEKRVIQSALGVLADNVANNAKDMVYQVKDGADLDGAASIVDADKISGTVVVRGAQTMGDAKDSLAVLALHSVQHTTLQEQGLIKEHFDPETGALRYQSYLGYRVIVDDSLPAVMGSNRITYTGILFGAGAFGYGAGNPEMPSEIERKASSGNGGGETVIHTRRTDIIHPNGFSFLSASVAGESATRAELANAANWNRTYERKNIPLAFIQTNG